MIVSLLIKTFCPFKNMCIFCTTGPGRRSVACPLRKQRSGDRTSHPAKYFMENKNPLPLIQEEQEHYWRENRNYLLANCLWEACK